MRERIFTVLGMLITWLAIFFIVPLMGFDIKMWVLIVTASIGGLFAGLLLLLRESAIENIILVVVAVVISGVLSGAKPGLGFIFISTLLSGVIGTITNQISQYAAYRAIKSGTQQSGAP